VEDIRMMMGTIKTNEAENETADPNNPNPQAECVPKR